MLFSCWLDMRMSLPKADFDKISPNFKLPRLATSLADILEPQYTYTPCGFYVSILGDAKFLHLVDDYVKGVNIRLYQDG